MTTANHCPARALPPWNSTAEAYWFFLPSPASVPEAAYAPLEAKSFYASPIAGKFRGGGLGTATVHVVRYTDTPAGTYDELLYIPGAFDNPSGKAHLRITRVYVSTEEAIYNGRKNWNIPKHLARFTFTRIQSEAATSPVKIQVFPFSPQDSPPFFSAIVTPSKWIPRVTLNTRYFPLDCTLLHPPLPSLEREAYNIVGTDRWLSVLPNMRGKADIVWFTPGGDGVEGSNGVKSGEYGDGVGFPKFIPWNPGVHMQAMILDFPEGKILEDKKTK